MARPLDKPTLITLPFDSFEDMISHYRKERRRRSYADRATHGSYRQILTDHGKAMIASDDPHYTEKRYWDAIHGTDFLM